MHKSLRLVAGAVLGTFAALTAQTALAQDTATTTVGGTVISLGGGFAYLTLPDTRFIFRYKDSGAGDTISKQENDTFDDFGGGFSGSIATPLGDAFGMPWVGAFHGYWSSIDNSNRDKCTTTNSSICAAADIIDQPGPSTVSVAGTLISDTARDVDSWGTAFELTTPNPSPVLLPGLFRNTHWGAAFDVRGLDQDLQIHGSTAGASDLFNYRESLDTTYYGGYLTFGGEYSIFPSLYSGYANVDYNGRFAGNGVGPTGLGLSEDNLAVIAGLKFETRKVQPAHQRVPAQRV
ncbi:MAG: hypothetical protein ABSA62_09450 [Methyloceanibacter sp.]